jgi:hypothetical protein
MQVMCTSGASKFYFLHLSITSADVHMTCVLFSPGRSSRAYKFFCFFFLSFHRLATITHVHTKSFFFFFPQPCSCSSCTHEMCFFSFNSPVSATHVHMSFFFFFSLSFHRPTAATHVHMSFFLLPFFFLFPPPCSCSSCTHEFFFFLFPPPCSYSSCAHEM